MPRLPLDDRCNTALFLPLDGLFMARRARIAEFALRQRIALFAPFREDAEAGALMAFGINLDEQWRLGASYVDKILNTEGCQTGRPSGTATEKVRDRGQPEDRESDRPRGADVVALERRQGDRMNRVSSSRA